jgi:hypothetical protein
VFCGRTLAHGLRRSSYRPGCKTILLPLFVAATPLSCIRTISASLFSLGNIRNPVVLVGTEMLILNLTITMRAFYAALDMSKLRVQRRIHIPHSVGIGLANGRALRRSACAACIAGSGDGRSGYEKARESSCRDSITICSMSSRNPTPWNEPSQAPYRAAIAGFVGGV